MIRGEKPYIVSFVSGKGGVGKTMLAVAFAKELSLGSSTLLIDLDFFNRGLSALLGNKDHIIASVPKPRFLQTEKTAENDTWSVVQVTDNLYHITYPDLQPSDMQKFVTLPVESLAEALNEFIQKAAKKCGCSFVVLDCHGGPDNSSFAASIVSDHTLLVSEPDRVTFRGTLNFLRQLNTVSDERDLQIHLVFNKVVPHFSGFYLKTFYNRLIRLEFGGRHLLGIFPLEVYLTKEFEKYPFLTEVYPNSLLAKKTRLMIHKLFASQEESSLSPAIRRISPPIKFFQMVTLGKTPWFLDLNNITLGIAAYFALSVFLEDTSLDPILWDTYFDAGKDFLIWYLMIVLLFRWFRRLDRKFVYFMRTRSHFLSILSYLTMGGMCFPIAWMCGTSLKELLAEETRAFFFYDLRLMGLGAWIFVPVWLVFLLTQAWTTCRLRFEGQPLEMASRIVFLIYLFIAPYLATLIRI